MIRRTRVSRRHAIVTMVAGLGVLVTACGPGTSPGAATKTDSRAGGAGGPAGRHDRTEAYRGREAGSGRQAGSRRQARGCRGGDDDRAGSRRRQGAVRGRGEAVDRRRRDVPGAALHQVVQRVQGADRRPGQLPVDRQRRRHQGDQRPDGRLRRDRRPDDRRAAQGRRRAARSSTSRWRSARSSRPTTSRSSGEDGQVQRRDAGRHLPRRDHKWNDAKIKADNPDLALPDKDIVVVHRSDGSGTTYIFTDYLSNVSPDWKSKVGAATSVNWPTGLGGQGNAGVADEVKQNPYAIGYVELIYALQQKLPPGAGQEQGRPVRRADARDARRRRRPASATSIPADLRASIVNAPGATAYPISGFTWLLAYKKMADKAKAIALTRLLWWGIYDGQKANAELGYAPLPAGHRQEGRGDDPEHPGRRRQGVPRQVSAAPVRPVGRPSLMRGRLARARASRRWAWHRPQAAQPPATRIGSAGPIDQVFKGVVTGLSGLVIVMLVGLIALLIVDSWPSLERYGLGFVTTSTWDPVREEFGALAVHLRHDRHLASGAADRDAGRGRRGAVPGRVRAAVAARPGLVRGRAAGGDPEHHLRPLGLLRPGAGDARRRRAVPQGDRSAPIPVLSALVQGPPLGRDILIAGVILAIMILPTIMAVSREVFLAVPNTQREGMIGAGRDEVGDDHLARCCRTPAPA